MNKFIKIWLVSLVTIMLLSTIFSIFINSYILVSMLGLSTILLAFTLLFILLKELIDIL
jgi:hypothetical protein